MKRKYAALVLGLTMSLTAMQVIYATDTEVSDTIEEEVIEEGEEVTVEEICGQVKEVGEDSITIVVGDLVYEFDIDDSLLDFESAEEEVEEELIEEEDLDSEDLIEEELLQDEIETILLEEDITETLQLSEEERSFVITEDTIIEKEIAYSESEKIESEEEETEENSEEIVYDVEMEEISLGDIQVGDVVQIILNENENVESITVLLMDEENILEASEVETESVLEESEEA